MAKKKTNVKKASVISLRALSNKAGMEYMKVFNNIKGVYNSLDHSDKMKLVNTFHDESVDTLKALGFYMKIHRIKDPE